MITYAEPENVPAVKKALTAVGATVLDSQIVSEGIRMSVEL